MAKKDELELDEFDNDDGLGEFEDIDFGDSPLGPPKSGRQAIVDFPKDLGKELFSSTIGDPLNTAKGLVEKSVPSEVSIEVSTLASEIDRIKDKSLAELAGIKKEAHSTLKAFNQIFPETGFLGSKIKFLADKLKGEDEQQKAREVSKEQQFNEKMNAELSSLFSKQQDAASAQAAIEQALEEHRHKSTSELLNNIFAETKQHRLQQLEISNAYYRKSLELKYRSVFLQSEMLEVQKTSFNLFKDQLSAITKNTGLPDFVKMNTTEFLKEAMKSRVTNMISSKFYTKFNGIEKLTDNVLSKIGEIGEGIKTGLSGVNTAVDAYSGMSEVSSTAGIVANLIRDFGLDKIGTRIGDKLGKYAPIRRAMFLTKEAVNDPKDGLRFAANEIDNMGKGKIYSLGTSLIAKGLKGVSNFASSDETAITRLTNDVDPNAPAIFSEATATSINVIIPQLLGKIYGETAALREHIIDDKYEPMIKKAEAELRDIDAELKNENLSSDDRKEYEKMRVDAVNKLASANSLRTTRRSLGGSRALYFDEQTKRLANKETMKRNAAHLHKQAIKDVHRGIESLTIFMNTNLLPEDFQFAKEDITLFGHLVTEQLNTTGHISNGATFLKNIAETVTGKKKCKDEGLLQDLEIGWGTNPDKLKRIVQYCNEGINGLLSNPNNHDSFVSIIKAIKYALPHLGDRAKQQNVRGLETTIGKFNSYGAMQTVDDKFTGQLRFNNKHAVRSNNRATLSSLYAKGSDKDTTHFAESVIQSTSNVAIVKGYISNPENLIDPSAIKALVLDSIGDETKVPKDFTEAIDKLINSTAGVSTNDLNMIEKQVHTAFTKNYGKKDQESSSSKKPKKDPKQSAAPEAPTDDGRTIKIYVKNFFSEAPENIGNIELDPSTRLDQFFTGNNLINMLKNYCAKKNLFSTKAKLENTFLKDGKLDLQLNNVNNNITTVDKFVGRVSSFQPVNAANGIKESDAGQKLIGAFNILRNIPLFKKVADTAGNAFGEIKESKDLKEVADFFSPATNKISDIYGQGKDRISKLTDAWSGGASLGEIGIIFKDELKRAGIDAKDVLLATSAAANLKELIGKAQEGWKSLTGKTVIATTASILATKDSYDDSEEGKKGLEVYINLTKELEKQHLITKDYPNDKEAQKAMAAFIAQMMLSGAVPDSPNFSSIVLSQELTPYLTSVAGWKALLEGKEPPTQVPKI